MKIISPFKDYYDYLTGIYGVDERIVYLRNSVKSNYVMSKERFLFDFSFADKLQKQYLVVNGRRYLFINISKCYFDKPQWVMFNYEQAIQDSKASYSYGRWAGQAHTYTQGYTCEELIDISRKVGSPVFSVIRSDWVRHKGYQLHIDGNAPRLMEYGFANIIPAEQLYQELEYFLSNILNESPDIKPPVTISNEDMIVSKGFDKKISFRHRKNK